MNFRVWVGARALDILQVPDKFVAIGGGVIGLEFACIYEGLGSQVTVSGDGVFDSARGRGRSVCQTA